MRAFMTDGAKARACGGGWLVFFCGYGFFNVLLVGVVDF